MVDRRLFGKIGAEDAPDGAPLGGTRAEAVQRLQVGLFGIFAMVLLVGLASAIGSQAEQAEQQAVPEAAPTTEPTEAPPQRDPLADAGVVPDIPAEPSPTPTGEAPILPEQGTNNPVVPPTGPPDVPRSN